MQTRKRISAVLIFSAIAYLAVACERDTPTAARPGRMATDVISTDLSQSYQVILSCTDGHSVVLSVDAATLTSLAADVDAINASGTGVSCTLDSTVLDPSSQTTASSARTARSTTACRSRAAGRRGPKAPVSFGRAAVERSRTPTRPSPRRRPRRCRG